MNSLPRFLHVQLVCTSKAPGLCVGVSCLFICGGCYCLGVWWRIGCIQSLIIYKVDSIDEIWIWDVWSSGPIILAEGRVHSDMCCLVVISSYLEEVVGWSTLWGHMLGLFAGEHQRRWCLGLMLSVSFIGGGECEWFYAFSFTWDCGSWCVALVNFQLMADGYDVVPSWGRMFWTTNVGLCWGFLMGT